MQEFDDSKQDLGLVLRQEDIDGKNTWVVPEDSMACFGLVDSECTDLQFKPKVGGWLSY